jgi:hypothetical protein
MPRLTERDILKSDFLIAKIDIENDYKLCSQIMTVIGINAINWLHPSKNSLQLSIDYLKDIRREQMGIKNDG